MNSRYREPSSAESSRPKRAAACVAGNQICPPEYAVTPPSLGCFSRTIAVPPRSTQAIAADTPPAPEPTLIRSNDRSTFCTERTSLRWMGRAWDYSTLSILFVKLEELVDHPPAPPAQGRSGSPRTSLRRSQ